MGAARNSRLRFPTYPHASRQLPQRTRPALRLLVLPSMASAVGSVPSNRAPRRQVPLEQTFRGLAAYYVVYVPYVSLATLCTILGVEDAVDVGTEQLLFEQLPALASEVARVEMIREYSGQY